MGCQYPTAVQTLRSCEPGFLPTTKPLGLQSFKTSPSISKCMYVCGAACIIFHKFPSPAFPYALTSPMPWIPSVMWTHGFWSLPIRAQRTQQCVEYGPVTLNRWVIHIPQQNAFLFSTLANQLSFLIHSASRRAERNMLFTIDLDSMQLSSCLHREIVTRLLLLLFVDGFS